MDKQELANKILKCTNLRDLNKFSDPYFYDNMDSEMKDIFYDMYTILFNKACLNKNNYPTGYIGNDNIDKCLQLNINLKYDKLKKDRKRFF